MEKALSHSLTARDNVSDCLAKVDVGHEDTLCKLTDISAHHGCPTLDSAKKGTNLC